MSLNKSLVTNLSSILFILLGYLFQNQYSNIFYSIGFCLLIKIAVNEVNEAQQASKALKTAYESGEDIPLTDVVMGIQKSSLAFEATLQIRNKVLKAYEEIMNMPV